MRKETVQVNISMGKELFAKVNEYAEKMSISRSGAISVLISQSLEQKTVMEAFKEVTPLYKSIETAIAKKVNNEPLNEGEQTAIEKFIQQTELVMEKTSYLT
jgi:metal-responsive CopG/Arc/MetJ family transcriptional regulator